MPADALVPPLVLQPLLENAVYHGIEPSSAPGACPSTSSCKGDEVHAILRNPYPVDGGGHHAGNKMALDNVRERLALHFDAEASLESRVRARDLRGPHPAAVPDGEGRRTRAGQAPPAPSAHHATRRRRHSGAPRGRRRAGLHPDEYPMAEPPFAS